MLKVLQKYWLHILLWLGMLIYVFVAPYLFALVFMKTGKPLRTEQTIPAESKRITFVIEDAVPYIEGDQDLYNLYGWAFITPDEGENPNSFIREVTLVSEKRIYFFAVKPGYRSPGQESMFTDAGVDLNTLGFNTLIAEDLIQPGKYRIGIVFRDPATGAAYYRDKPEHYLIKTPNTLYLANNK